MPERSRSLPWGWLLALGAVLGAAALILVWALPGVDLDAAQIRTWVRARGPWGPVLIAGLEFAQVFISPLTGHVVEAASGFVYGPWLGTLYCMIGIVAGSLAVFSLARRLGRPFAVRLIGPTHLAQLDDLARRGGSLLFFLIWLLPLLPDDLACLAAGLTPMPTGRFLVLLILGRLPGIWTSNWVGASAARLDPALWAAVLAGAALAALVVWRWGARARLAGARLLDRIVRAGRA